MGVIAWLKSKSAGEMLSAKALVEFAEHDSKDALGDLMQGLVDLADGTRALAPLLSLQGRMASYNLIPALAAAPVVLSMSQSPATPTTAVPTK